MALKALMLRKQITDKKKALEELRSKDETFVTREAELEAAIGEANTEDERKAVEESVEKFDSEKAEHEESKNSLETEINGLEAELEEVERSAQANVVKPEQERKEEKKMENRTKFFGMNIEQRDAFFARDEVKEFLERARNFAQQERSVTGAELTIPDEMLGLIREEVARQSKLLRFVRVVNVSGKSRQNIMGAIPEAVWTEMCASINELNIGFNQIEVDGYKVGGYIAICNSTLNDSDVALATEIINAIGGAIAKALDKAILFGTGTKMPTGIVTRLAQTSEPSDWGANAPAWTDLHTSNILKLNIDGSTGVQFFTQLVVALGVAKPKYSSEGLFWVMNRTTHMKIKAYALAFDSSAALVSSLNNTMPVVGGEIVEFEDDEIANNDIIGGYGGNYLMAQRQGATFNQSEHVFFLQDQTAFKGIARYDGKPVAGEAFVVVNFANSDAETTKTFPVDYANAEMNMLAVTAAASATTSGKTVLTVTNTIAQSDAVLKYKAGVDVTKITVGQRVNNWTALTSGTTEIAAAAGTVIGVVELDANNRVVSVGSVASVPKA